MAFVDSTNLKSSYIPIIKYSTAVIVITASVLFATVAVDSNHRANNQIVTDVQPILNMGSFASEI